jgi:hypothetical protein
MIITSPVAVRARFPGQTSRATMTTAARSHPGCCRGDAAFAMLAGA